MLDDIWMLLPEVESLREVEEGQSGTSQKKQAADSGEIARHTTQATGRPISRFTGQKIARWWSVLHDALYGRRLAARTLPPVTIRELRLALQDEWAAMPQQLIDTLILSMGRRCETCSVAREIISPTKDRIFLINKYVPDYAASGQGNGLVAGFAHESESSAAEREKTHHVRERCPLNRSRAQNVPSHWCGK
ncbi:hypothetical protein TNCV_3538251 [Trichonephila clavipes]|nr:hypothetical protein TNCV_3538251 [Trichonephila clavipes]